MCRLVHPLYTQQKWTLDLFQVFVPCKEHTYKRPQGSSRFGYLQGQPPAADATGAGQDVHQAMHFLLIMSSAALCISSTWLVGRTISHSGQV
jgi:hypothetical protein